MLSVRILLIVMWSFIGVVNLLVLERVDKKVFALMWLNLLLEYCTK